MLEEKFQLLGYIIFSTCVSWTCCSSANLHICSSWRLIKIWFSFLFNWLILLSDSFLHLIYFFTDLYYYTYHIYYTYVYLSYPVWVNFLANVSFIIIFLFYFFHVFPPQWFFFSFISVNAFLNVFNLGVLFLQFFSASCLLLRNFFKMKVFILLAMDLELERTKGY